MFQPIRCAWVIIACSFILSAAWVPAQETGSLADLIAKIEPSVVRIDFTRGESKGIGSGYVIGEDGTIATNYHVIAGATEATAIFKNGDKVDVQGTVWLDKKRDIAILKIDKPGLTALPLADQLPRAGDSVIAIGNPVGLSFSTSEGIVSSVRQGKELSEDDPLPGTWIQTTAPISPGNSGGPLVNREGKVVAMNTRVLLVGQNLNFAISSIDVADAYRKTIGKKMLSLADGASKAKPNKLPSKSTNEFAAKDIPAAALDAFVLAAQKGYRQAVSDARKKLTEAKEVLSGMKEGSTNAPKPATGRSSKAMADNSAKAPDANPESTEYTTQMFKGKKYYHFPDSETKDKCVAAQQAEVAKAAEVVKKIDDSQQGMLNYVKTTGTALQLNSVGSLGSVSELPIFLISDDDEFRTYVDDVPVIVRGIRTDKLAIGSNLDGRVMYVAGTESFRIETSKVNIFVLREVPDEMLLDRLKSGSSGGLATAGKTAIGADTASKAASSANTQAASTVKPTDFRTWSDKTGKFTLEARLVTKVDNQVVLKRRDNGKVITLSIDQLSQADQAFLKANAAGANP